MSALSIVGLIVLIVVAIYCGMLAIAFGYESAKEWSTRWGLCDTLASIFGLAALLFAGTAGFILGS